MVKANHIAIPNLREIEFMCGWEKWQSHIAKAHAQWDGRSLWPLNNLLQGQEQKQGTENY